MTIQYFEGVRRGHPDKAADILANRVAAEIAKLPGTDGNVRTAVEVMINAKSVIIAGEVSHYVPGLAERVARDFLKEMDWGHGDNSELEIQDFIVAQSDEIRDLVLSSEDLGAGDQGLMIGWATPENEYMMPLGFVAITEIMWALDKSDIKGLLSDGKGYIKYNIEENTAEVHISTQGTKDLDARDLKNVVKSVLDKLGIELIGFTHIIFQHGGPYADTGLTGRKLACDTYGGIIGHGGGATAGKELAKVDRSGVYLARALAKAYARKYDQEATVKLGYVIGQTKPQSIEVYLEDGTVVVETNESIPTVAELIKLFGKEGTTLPIPCEYSHFVSLNKDLPWETLDFGDRI